jgi:hypothetical protein
MDLFSRACRPSVRQTVWAVIFFLTLGGGTVLLRRGIVSGPLRYVVAGLPLLTGFFYMWTMVGDIRRQMDELQLRIYLEAAAITLAGLFVLILVYPLFESIQVVGRLDFSVVVFLLVGLFLAGYVIAVRRYR